MGKPVRYAMQDALNADSAVTDLLPGLVWTREIKPPAPPGGSQPGATPEAFDGTRIKRCLSIMPSAGSTFYTNAPRNTYWDTPELFVRCLPHESEKALAEQAIHEIERCLLAAGRLEGAQGEGLLLSLSGQIGPYDDPIIDNAVVYVVRVQVDSVWRV